MPNPRGINQYSKGKSSGTFHLGTKSANSSNAGSTRKHADPFAGIKPRAKKKK